MAKAYLSLGTNIGNRRGNLIRAAALLAERTGDILALSSLYETEPWGFDSPHPFLNAALVLETGLSPLELLDATRLIEIEMGRVEKSVGGAYEDRTIDLDLLLYDDVVMQTPRLTLPHPLMHRRAFVLEPLAEIAPEAVHPVFHQTIRQLYQQI